MLKQFSNPGKMSKKLRRMGGMPGIGGMPAQAADSVYVTFGINRLTGQYTQSNYGGDRHGC